MLDVIVLIWSFNILYEFIYTAGCYTYIFVSCARILYIGCAYDDLKLTVWELLIY